MKKSIKVGDIVDVYFSATPCLFKCEVLYLPCATGDSWILKDEEGLVHHVVLFDRISQRAKEEQLPF